jgi:5-oxoprolinase (ATP-hydrolysing) subunit A
MQLQKIDINCDMGESKDFLDSGHDKFLMQYFSSVNIACGFHAGSTEIMTETAKNAIRYGLKIGAHPGFDDKENFGRKEIELTYNEIVDLVTVQICSLLEITKTLGVKLNHIKPHGALYNMSASREDYAIAIADAVLKFDSNLILVGLSGSLSISTAEKKGLKCYNEVFADRAYTNDGKLASRNLHIKDVLNQTESFLFKKPIKTIDGGNLIISADTICLHSDTPSSLNFAKSIHKIVSEKSLD